ncbi:hypothetical protein ALC57_18627 [Trachymyrmex cornetzi]|uniref:Uncharacterized protein n=1 Tax=Trachymyrmex cornetzi TaxID=471704 RepID=A0A151IRB8_9HYME|nr:hypothetical protein ALC57_18627 [Trachymyrmex cornetzi]
MTERIMKLEKDRSGSTGELAKFTNRKREGEGGESEDRKMEEVFRINKKTLRSPVKMGEEGEMKEILKELKELKEMRVEMRDGLKGMNKEIREVAKGQKEWMRKEMEKVKEWNEEGRVVFRERLREVEWREGRGKENMKETEERIREVLGSIEKERSKEMK